MIVQEEWVSITTTPDVVVRYLTEPALMNQWRSPLITFEPIEGELMTLGSSHMMRLKSLALAGATYHVAERDDQHILLKISGLWEGQELWRWFVDGSRVVVQNRVEYEVANESLRVFVVGIGRFMAELDMRIQLFRLRELIEGPATARSTGSRSSQRVVVEE